MTPAVIASARVAAYKHGRKAKVVTPAQGWLARVRRIHPDAPEVIKAAIAAVGGDIDPYFQESVRGLVDLDLLRRTAMDKIREEGVVVEDQIPGVNGTTIRKKAHPLISEIRHFHAILGMTAEETRLTRKSQGEGAKDQAIVDALRRRELLRSHRGGLLPPADPIEVEVVEEKAAKG